MSGRTVVGGPYPGDDLERHSGDVSGGGGPILKESNRLSEAVAAARRGEARGWDVLFTRFHADVHAYALARLGAWEDAQDVTQETFVAAVGALRALRDDHEPVVQAWLLHICRHKVIDRLRRRGRERRPLDLAVVAADDPAAAAEMRIEADEVRRAMAGLTEEQRDILVQRFVLDLSLEEVAASTRRSVGAVKSLQHRALASLRRILAGAST
jgi:RNA polymerase sigma-70 factor (ECF subfamily)